MTHLGEGDLQALVDGEPAAGSPAAKAHLRSCSACADALARLRLDTERVSALLGVADHAPPMLAAQAEFHRRRRGGAPRAAASGRRALARAAVLVLAFAGAAAAAVVPGSPVREWVGGLGAAERDAAPGPVPEAPPVVEAEPALAPKAVSLAPSEGRIRVVVTGADPGLRVRVRITDQPLAGVTATGEAARARFRTGPGRIEIVSAGPGEAVVNLPASAEAASVEIDGRVVAATEGGALRALVPPVGGSAAEPVFSAGS
jgi:hypothetical protein